MHSADITPQTIAPPRLWPWAIGALAVHGLLLVALADAPSNHVEGRSHHLSLVLVEGIAPSPPPAIATASTSLASAIEKRPTTPIPQPTVHAQPILPPAPQPVATVAETRLAPQPPLSTAPDTVQTAQTPAVDDNPLTTTATAVLASSAQTTPLTADTPTTAGRAAAAATPSSPPNTQIVALQGLLHSAIDGGKRYPLSALRMGREGSTRIAFELAPDGQLEKLNIASSSGYSVLDRAAMAAVKGIEPFTIAMDFIQRPEAFEIDVVFGIYRR